MGLKFISYTLSSKDVPGRWSLVVFLPGCNFRCRHCHNWRLVLGEEEGNVSEEDIFYEIEKNPFIEVLVISGGEPTVHEVEKLRKFILRVKQVNPSLSVRIDTNGYRPNVLEELRDLIDGFAMDIKAPLNDQKLYSYTAGVEVDTNRVLDSITIADGMPLTIYRTPSYPWLSREGIEEIRKLTENLKSPWFLNEFFEIPSCPFNG